MFFTKLKVRCRTALDRDRHSGSGEPRNCPAAARSAGCRREGGPRGRGEAAVAEIRSTSKCSKAPGSTPSIGATRRSSAEFWPTTSLPSIRPVVGSPGRLHTRSPQRCRACENDTQEELKVRLFGDSAVVTSRIKLEKGPRSHGLTNVYVKRQAHWRCVASQASWIGEAKTLQPSLTAKGVDSLQLTVEEQSTAAVALFAGKVLHRRITERASPRRPQARVRVPVELSLSQGAVPKPAVPAGRPIAIGCREVGMGILFTRCFQRCFHAHARSMSFAYDHVSNA